MKNFFFLSLLGLLAGCSTADNLTYPTGRFKPVNPPNFIPPTVEVYKRKVATPVNTNTALPVPKVKATATAQPQKTPTKPNKKSTAVARPVAGSVANAYNANLVDDEAYYYTDEELAQIEQEISQVEQEISHLEQEISRLEQEQDTNPTFKDKLKLELENDFNISLGK